MLLNQGKLEVLKILFILEVFATKNLGDFHNFKTFSIQYTYFAYFEDAVAVTK